MKKFKNLARVIVMTAMLALVAPLAMPVCNTAVAQAASTIKLTKKSVSLEVGKTTVLKVKGAKKVKWASSDKSVATVNKAGKVTAVKAGTAKVTATVNKKKYTCTVTVTAPVDPAIANAPFEGRFQGFGTMKAVTPKTWTGETSKPDDNTYAYMLYPQGADKTAGTSNITVLVQDTGSAAPDYDTMKKAVESTGSAVQALLQAGGYANATVSNFKQSDYTNNNVKAFKSEFKVDFKTNDGTVSKNVADYVMYVGTNLVEVIVADNGTALTPDVNKVAEYIVDTIQLTK